MDLCIEIYFLKLIILFAEDEIFVVRLDINQYKGVYNALKQDNRVNSHLSLNLQLKLTCSQTDYGKHRQKTVIFTNSFSHLCTAKWFPFVFTSE